MRCKLKLAVITAMLTVMICGLCVYASSVEQLTFKGEVHTGQVRITLQEESEPEQEPVSARMQVDYETSVKNAGAPCYVRVKIGVDPGSGDILDPDAAGIYGIDDNWIRRGDYYYYTDILEEDQSAEIFQGFVLPSEIDCEFGGDINVAVRAEAVQSRNFVPDFTAVLPWGAMLLEDVAVNEGAAKTQPVTDFSEVTFADGSVLECSSRELFGEYDEIMPADQLQQCVTLKNPGEDHLHLFSRIMTNDGELDDRLMLEIRSGSEIVFSGTAAEAGRAGEIRAGVIKGNSAEDLSMILELPAGSDNTYQLKGSDIVWQIRAEAADMAAQTNDDSDLRPALFAVLLSLVIMLILTIRKRDF